MSESLTPPMPNRMTDAEIAEIGAAWGYGSGSATYIINRILGELKAARAELKQRSREWLKVDSANRAEIETLRAELDAARAQAFEEAAQIAERMFPGGFVHCSDMADELRRHAAAPDGSRTATPEGK